MEIITHPNEMLSNKTKDVSVVQIRSNETKRLIGSMIHTMIENDGIGLSANQVGVPINLFVYRIEDEIKALFNAKIIARTGNFTMVDEGCLSMPGKVFNTKRQKMTIISALDRDGNEVRIKSRNKLEAVIFQHEIDHLNGKLILDRKK